MFKIQFRALPYVDDILINTSESSPFLKALLSIPQLPNYTDFPNNSEYNETINASTVPILDHTQNPTYPFYKEYFDNISDKNDDQIFSNWGEILGVIGITFIFSMCFVSISLAMFEVIKGCTESIEALPDSPV